MNRGYRDIYNQYQILSQKFWKPKSSEFMPSSPRFRIAIQFYNNEFYV